MTIANETQAVSPRKRRTALWRRLAGAAWRAARWPIVVGLFAGVIGLGWIGFDESLRAQGQPGTFWDKLYLSLQLLVLQSGAVAPPVSWQLEVARFLAPAVTAYATLRAVAALLGEQISGMRARMCSEHVVICGLGRLGALLAKNLRTAGHDVVALESDLQNGAVGECREEGVIVLIGDATDRALLRRAGVERARFLVAVTGDDAANTEIAQDARRLRSGRSGPPLTCFVHVSHDKLGGVLRRAGMTWQAGDSFRMETFNAAERGVPALLRKQPAFDDHGSTPLGPPHVVIVGLGEMGANLVIKAARRWRSIPERGRRRFRVTVVDSKADEHVAALNERFPRLSSMCVMEAHRMEIDSAAFERAEFLFDSKGHCSVTGVYVCVGDDAIGLSAALHLRHRLGDRDVPIVVRTTHEGGVAALVRGDAGSGRYAGLDIFGLFDLVSRPDVLLRGQNEILARAIHEEYQRRQRLKGDTRATDPSVVDWEELAEALRESNRHQAADIFRKLRLIGCDIEPLTDWDSPLATLSSEEVENLARLEHERWLHERKAAGWRYSAHKNEARKLSPYLVPWDELSEEVKANDRDTAGAMPAYLAEVDLAVVRPTPSG